MGNSKYVDPVKDRKTIEEIIETVIKNYAHTGQKFPEGAAARIRAQLPSIIMNQEALADELVKAFTRERNLYF